MELLYSILSPLSIAAYVAVAFLLFRRNLVSQYRFFWLYLITEVVAVVASYAVQGNLNARWVIYLAAQPPILIFNVLMVVEVFRKVFIRFPGIARYGQRVILVSMLLAFLVALISIGGDLREGWSTASIMVRSSAITRAISSTVTLYFVCIAVFLVWMPIPLPANTIRHSFVSFFYFLLVTSVHYLLNRTQDRSLVPIANLALQMITIGSLTAWGILLRPSGEALPEYNPPKGTNTSAILVRLEALNRTLSPPRTNED